ncbi:MAG: acyltransferase [Cetobacterium sp.]
MNSFYTEEELKKIGFKKLGQNVLISRKAQIYNPEDISIENNVRIDDFTIISGKISIGNYVHIGAHCFLSGKYGITFKDFSGISIRCTILTVNDNWTGEFLQNPMVPEEFRKVTGGSVVLEEYVNVGTNSTIFPNVTLAKGVAVGAGSYIFKSIKKEWTLNISISNNKLTSIPRSSHMETLGIKLLNLKK